MIILKKYIKIKLNSYDELPLNKTIEICSIIITIRVFFMKITILSTYFLRSNYGKYTNAIL